MVFSLVIQSENHDTGLLLVDDFTDKYDEIN